MNLEKYKKTFQTAESMNNTDTSQPEWYGESSLPGSEIPVCWRPADIVAVDFLTNPGQKTEHRTELPTPLARN